MLEVLTFSPPGIFIVWQSRQKSSQSTGEERPTQSRRSKYLQMDPFQLSTEYWSALMCEETTQGEGGKNIQKADYGVHLGFGRVTVLTSHTG